MVFSDRLKLDKITSAKTNPMRTLAIGFAIVILLGGILLSMPFSSANGESTPFIDSLFTSATSVCVTGLVTVDTGTHWNLLGKTIILILIQTGGLGFMTFTTLTAVILGRRLGLKDRLIMQEAYNAMNLQGIIRMVRYVFLFTVTVEGVGALFLMTRFIPEFGIRTGIFYGIFHSVSAFCNAGIDLLGNFDSLTKHNTDKIMLLTISCLIVVGGLGFSVWNEILNFRKKKRMSFHARVVLSTTGFLILTGAVMFFVFEYNNPATLKGMSFLDKITNSLLTSITPRTAGFNSISTSEMTMGGRLLTMIFMFIGGSPGSTAGGVKTTTFAVLLLTAVCYLKGRDDPEAFGRRLDKDTVYKSFSVFTIGLGLVFLVSLIISFAESGTSITFENIFYESISAFGTVGLTEGITPSLHTVSKAALIFGMYSGRVGPLTVLFALSSNKSPAKITYPEGRILIG